MQADRLFLRYRTPDSAWERELARIAPRRDRMSHLVIAWYAGTPVLWTNTETGRQFVNGQRWVIHEAVPAQYVPTLEHRVWTMDVISSDVRLSREWAKQGYVLSPFWTIQGDDCGHPYRLSAAEADANRANGLPDKMPMVGELPYAEPSDRTWALLMERSLIYGADRHASMWERQQARRQRLERQQRQGIIAVADETAEVTKEASDALFYDGRLTVRRDRNDPRARFADSSETDAYYLESGLVEATPGA